MEPRNIAPNARAAVFAAVCTLLAVAAHRSMSASAVPAFAMAFGAVAAFGFARIAAALGERGLPSITLLVGGSQVGLHLLFQAAQASSVRSGTSSMPGMAGMPNMAGMPGMAGAPSPSFLGTTTGMTAAHVAAAVVTAWWLRRGEAALFAVAGRAGVRFGASWRMVAAWIAGVRPVASASVAAGAAGVDVRRLRGARVLLFTVIRRGPPPAAAW